MRLNINQRRDLQLVVWTAIIVSIATIPVGVLYGKTIARPTPGGSSSNVLPNGRTWSYRNGCMTVEGQPGRNGGGAGGSMTVCGTGTACGGEGGVGAR